MIDSAIAIQAAGTSITTGVASASAAIPVNSSGIKPTYARVSVSAAAFVKIGQSAVAATANDILVIPGDAIILKVSGNTHIAAIQQTLAGVCNVTPLEDS